MKTHSELLDELFEVAGLIDDLNQRSAEAQGRRKEIENQLIDAQKVSGLTSMSNDKISVTFTPNTARAVPDPEHWDEIHKWFVDSGYGYCIHRRMSDSKVLDLLMNGVELPKGLSFEFYTKVAFRRK